MVYSVAYNVLGNHTDAEDAAQEAFLRCYRKLPQYRERGDASRTWLFRLALTPRSTTSAASAAARSRSTCRTWPTARRPSWAKA